MTLSRLAVASALSFALHALVVRATWKQTPPKNAVSRSPESAASNTFIEIDIATSHQVNTLIPSDRAHAPGRMHRRRTLPERNPAVTATAAQIESTPAASDRPPDSEVDFLIETQSADNNAGVLSQAKTAPGSAAEPPSVGNAENAALVGRMHARLKAAALQCYPPAAQRFGRRGTVELAFCVDLDLHPIRVSLKQTSGSEMLDTAARDCVLPNSSPFPEEAAEKCFQVPVRFGV